MGIVKSSGLNKRQKCINDIRSIFRLNTISIYAKAQPLWNEKHQYFVLLCLCYIPEMACQNVVRMETNRSISMNRNV